MSFKHWPRPSWRDQGLLNSWLFFKGALKPAFQRASGLLGTPGCLVSPTRSPGPRPRLRPLKISILQIGKGAIQDDRQGREH